MRLLWRRTQTRLNLRIEEIKSRKTAKSETETETVAATEMAHDASVIVRATVTDETDETEVLMEATEVPLM